MMKTDWCYLASRRVGLWVRLEAVSFVETRPDDKTLPPGWYDWCAAIVYFNGAPSAGIDAQQWAALKQRLQLSD